MEIYTQTIWAGPCFFMGIVNSSCQVRFQQFFSHPSVDLAETQAVLYGGYVSSTDSVYPAGTRTNQCTCRNVQPYRTQQVYRVCARPCQHFLCVHGHVHFSCVHGRAGFFPGTAVLAFFPVRPCHGFSLYGRVTFFHVRPCHRCAHKHSRPVFISKDYL